MEKTVQSHLLELSRSLDAYRAAVRKAQDHFSFEVEQLWRDQAELRDELNENVTTLSNRIESVANVAARIVTDANRAMVDNG